MLIKLAYVPDCCWFLCSAPPKNVHCHMTECWLACCHTKPTSHDANSYSKSLVGNYWGECTPHLVPTIEAQSRKFWYFLDVFGGHVHYFSESYVTWVENPSQLCSLVRNVIHYLRIFSRYSQHTYCTNRLWTEGGGRWLLQLNYCPPISFICETKRTVHMGALLLVNRSTQGRPVYSLCCASTIREDVGTFKAAL